MRVFLTSLDRLERRGFFILLACFTAATIAIALRAAPYVGAFTDDAGYIMNALALLRGHYHNLSSLSSASYTQYWPGYPLALLPWVALMKPHWDLLRVSSVLMGLIYATLFFILGRRYLRRWTLLCAGAAFLLHPLTLGLSSSVISETLYIPCTLTFFLLLDRQLNRPDIGQRIGLACLLAFTVWVRPVGLSLYAATLLAAWQARRLREGLTLSLLALPLWALFPVWQSASVHGAPTYIAMWNTEKSLLLTHYIDHMHRLLYLFFSDSLLGVRLSHDQTLLSLMATAAGMAIWGWGLRAALQQFPRWRALTWAMAGYVAATIAVHSFHLALDDRYLWPTVPYLVLFFTFGLSDLLRRGASRVAVGMGLSLWLLALFWPNGPLLMRTVRNERPLNYRLPAQTFDWMRGHIPTDTAILGRQPMLFLYTGLRGVDLITASDRDAFAYALIQDHIGYTVFTPGRINMPLRIHPRQNEEWLLMTTYRYVSESPTLFEPVYANATEQTRIFHVRADALFLRAYARYLAGVDALHAGQWRAAQMALNASLRDAPGLGSAWTARGLLYYLQGNFAAAASDFRKALMLNPEDILANLHLARVESLAHDKNAAVASYQRAIDTIEASGDYDDLLPIIHAEQSALR